MSDKPNIMFGAWLQVRPGVFGCLAAKCGSQSLKHAAFGIKRVKQLLDLREERVREGLFDPGPFTPWQVAKMKGRKVLGIKRPLDRFASLWRDKSLAMEEAGLPSPLAGLSPEQAIEHVERFPFGDSHWFPQAAYMVPDVETVRHDQIFDALDLEPVRLNSRPAETPALPELRVISHYNADQRLWEAL